MKNLLLIVLMLLSLTVTAQKNFLPGLVVFTNNDTAYGYINYRGWDVNPRKIEFQQNLAAPTQNFEVKDVKYFRIEGKDAYKRAVVLKDMAPVNVSYLEEEGYSLFVKDTVFLLEVVKGERLTLYELKDSKLHYYVEKVNEGLIPLEYKVFFKRRQSGSIVFQNIFRDQLKSLTVDENIIRVINDSRYNKRDLTKVFLLLDPPSSITVKQEEELKLKKLFRPLLGAGINYNSLKVVEEPTLSGLKSSSPVFTIMAGFNLFTGKNLDKFFMNYSLAYSSYHWQPEYQRKANYLLTNQTVRYDLKLNTITTGVVLNYGIINNTKQKFYLGTGIMANFAFIPKNEFTVEYESGDITKHDPIVNSNFWTHFPIKAGMNFKNLDISLSTSIVNHFNQSDDHRSRYKMKYHTSSFLVAYQF